MRKVMIVDDHEIVRCALREMLTGEFGVDVVAEAGGVAEAIRVLDACQADLIIVDLNLGDEDGLDLCRLVGEGWPNVRTLVLSASMDPSSIAAAIEAGATGYVLKGAPAAELVAAVGHALSGRQAYAPSTARVIVDETRARRARAEALRVLSGPERVVHDLRAQGWAPADIAERMNLSLKTVRNYVASSERKLGRAFQPVGSV